MPCLQPPANKKNTSQQHKIVDYAQMLNVHREALTPTIWTDNKLELEADKILPKNLHKILVIAPIANWQGKCWPLEKYIQLIKKLCSHNGPFAGEKVLIVGASNEYQQSKELITAVEQFDLIVSFGHFSLNILATLLKRCHLFIGNDSGLMHMACACDIPVIALFGPSSEHVYGPWNSKARVIRTQQTFKQIISSPDYDHRSNRSFMDDISVHTVYETACDLIQ